MRRWYLSQVFPILALTFALAIPVQSQGKDALRERMLERRGEIVKLLQSGKAGENSKGFLEARGSLDGREKGIMDAENNDRRSVYESLARKNKTDGGAVGVLRAEQIRGNLPGRAWYQLPSGQWIQAP